MRLFARSLFVFATLALLVNPVASLEKSSVRLDAERLESWNVSTPTTIAYYNLCTGWAWTWSGFAPEDRVGVEFRDLGPFVVFLNTSQTFVFSTPPSGYGFTGTIGLYSVDAQSCPVEPPIAEHPYLPAATGWQVQQWGGVGMSDPMVLAITMADQPGNPLAFASDHPAAGPTGPAACGTCFPSTRSSHSYLYGTMSTPYCPGVPLSDGTCDAELLVEVSVKCCGGLSVEDASWGSVKGLYR